MVNFTGRKNLLLLLLSTLFYFSCDHFDASIGGTVTGLSGTLVLQNNGRDDLTVTSNGEFVFEPSDVNQSSYSVKILTQPAGQKCKIKNGKGTTDKTTITNIKITCVNISSGDDNNPPDPEPLTFTIGGTTTGLAIAESVVLQNNGADDNVIVSNGGFTFSTEIEEGSSYNVTVLTQPLTQTCSVTSGSGIVSTDVTNVTLTCADNSYTLGGTITGLTGTLSLNDFLLSGSGTYTTDGSYTLSPTYVTGDSYQIEVSSQPMGQFCTVRNGTGTVATSNVTDIDVDCENTFSVGGTISGLTDTVSIDINGGSTLVTSSNGAYSFDNIVDGTVYLITINTQPSGQTCIVSNDAGTVSGADVTNADIVCTP